MKLQITDPNHLKAFFDAPVGSITEDAILEIELRTIEGRPTIVMTVAASEFCKPEYFDFDKETAQAFQRELGTLIALM